MNYLILKIHLPYFIFIAFCLIASDLLVSQETSKKKINKFISSIDDIESSEKAFRFKAEFITNNRIKLSWSISDNCYLYKNNFNFHTSTENKIRISNLPKGVTKEDEYFGKVEVFYSYVQVFLDLQKWQNNVLRVSYQGCNETGFCYPPIKKTLKIIPEKKEIIVF